MAPRQSRIVELTNIISTKTAKIDQYLSENNVPQPTFDVNGPGSLNLSQEMQDNREEVLNANLELQELLLGPKEVIADYQYNYYIAVQAVCKYDIAKAFPVDEEATFDDIAKSCGLSEQMVRRVVRFAASHRIFKEVRKDVIVHTAFSKLLLDDPQFRDYCLIGGEDMWPAASQTVPAMLKWPGSEESNQSGFALAHDTDDSVYVYLGKHPEKAKRFASAMSVSLSGEGYSSKYVAGCGPWASIKDDGLVVDVGGSNGDIMVAIAKSFPTLRFVVEDLQSQIDIAPKLPDEVSDRIKMQSYDFFTPQPVQGADVYFFRWIFHNWADKYCLRILENLIPALKSRALIVLNEWCLPEPNESPNRWERRLRGMDLAMMTLQNSKERDRDDWINLFARASERFHLNKIQRPKGSQLSIIEFEWR